MAGVPGGRVSEGYQSCSEISVTAPEAPPTSRQSPTKPISASSAGHGGEAPGDVPRSGESTFWKTQPSPLSMAIARAAHRPSSRQAMSMSPRMIANATKLGKSGSAAMPVTM